MRIFGMPIRYNLLYTAITKWNITFHSVRTPLYLLLLFITVEGSRWIIRIRIIIIGERNIRVDIADVLRRDVRCSVGKMIRFRDKNRLVCDAAVDETYVPSTHTD